VTRLLLTRIPGISARFRRTSNLAQAYTGLIATNKRDCTVLSRTLRLAAVLVSSYFTSSAPGITFFSGSESCCSSSGCGNALRGSI